VTPFRKCIKEWRQIHELGIQRLEDLQDFTKIESSSPVSSQNEKLRYDDELVLWKTSAAHDLPCNLETFSQTMALPSYGLIDILDKCQQILQEMHEIIAQAKKDLYEKGAGIYAQAGACKSSDGGNFQGAVCKITSMETVSSMLEAEFQSQELLMMKMLSAGNFGRLPELSVIYRTQPFIDTKLLSRSMKTL